MNKKLCLVLLNSVKSTYFAIGSIRKTARIHNLSPSTVSKYLTIEKIDEKVFNNTKNLRIIKGI